MTNKTLMKRIIASKGTCQDVGIAGDVGCSQCPFRSTRICRVSKPDLTLKAAVKYYLEHYIKTNAERNKFIGEIAEELL